MSPSVSPLVIDTIGTPTLWTVTILGVLALLAADFVITRKPHEVSMREAVAWSAFYVALPLAFGVWVWSAHGSQRGVEYYTGYLVEKTLSIDNLFVFMLLLAAFAVPAKLQQKVLLFGIAGALVLRGVFIALGAAALESFDAVFLVFGLVLAATGVKLLRDAMSGRASGAAHETSVDDMRVVRVVRRLVPGITPFALVVVAVLATDVLFAVDSVPAVYGITGDPYLVFATNAFALLGLRALYFVVKGALTSLVHLDYGLAAILVFIGAKLGLHWAHLTWPAVPEIPTLLSLGVIVAILGVATLTSLRAARAVDPREAGAVEVPRALQR